MQLHIILTNGVVLRQNITADFKLSDWLTLLRVAGYVATPDAYVSAHSVAAAVIIKPEGESEVTLWQAPVGGKPN